MPRELRYRPQEEREEVQPDGTTLDIMPIDPDWLLGFWCDRYRHTRGANRRTVFAGSADTFRVEAALAERMLKGDVPHRVEPDGTLAFAVD
jgi:hypothetical protein